MPCSVSPQATHSSPGLAALRHFPALPARILIVRLGAIGDVVNALALATAIKDAAPTVEIGWAVHELALPLVHGHPSIARVHVWRRARGLAALQAVVREIRAQHYELAIDLQRLAKSALLARASGAKRVLGFDRARCKELSWLAYSERLAPAPHARPMVLQYLEFASHLGLTPRAPRFSFPPDAGAKSRVEAWLGELGGAAPLVFNIGASKPANRWPLDHWARLVQLARARFSRPIVLAGGPQDRSLAAQILSDPGARETVLDLTGQTSLLDYVELAREAALVVSGDTGPMHVAAAAGARVIALFGAADARRTGPFELPLQPHASSARHALVQASPAPSCAPCNAATCRLPRHACMLDLDPASVVEAMARSVGPSTRQSPGPA